MFMTPPARNRASSAVLDRRLFLAGIVGTAALTACGAKAKASGPALAPSAPLPTKVPSGTKLNIADPQGSMKLGLQLAGLLGHLSFSVPQWPNLNAGPDVINAFRAHSLDLASNAGIPPIQAHFQGSKAHIVAVGLTRKPSYVFATKQHSDVQKVADFKGKKLAFSQGQAQGVVLLRALHEVGLTPKDVTLVPLTSDQFLTALQAGQVDVAPLSTLQVTQYLNKYGRDGAHQLKTDVVDLLSILWAPDDVLADSGKAAAIAEFIPLWAKSKVWIWEHPDEWIQQYYVKSQGITAEQGKQIVALSNKPLFPPKWDEALAWEQETAKLLAQGGFVKSFDTDALFDRRFESLAADAVAETYRR
jgi:sulfonate transport system substrate-binding protein